MKRLLVDRDVCIQYYRKLFIQFWILVNKSSPLAQFSIDYEEIDDDDEEEEQQQQINNNHSWNNHEENLKYELLVD